LDLRGLRGVYFLSKGRGGHGGVGKGEGVEKGINREGRGRK